jgi:hypothetical protein
MRNILQSMIITTIMMTAVVGWMGENTAWAKSCPQHQGVKDQVTDLNQAQQFSIPPSIQQRNQVNENNFSVWKKAMVGILILMLALGLGVVVRLQRQRFSPMPQLSLPYSTRDPLLVMAAAA